MRAALRDQAESAVPCDGCTACCRSAQFVHIGPEETDTLARIPAELLVPAPGQPGHRVMGYDERGHCPMLVDGACSIYAHRPKTCRTYDCRIYAAAGVETGRPEIDARVRQWQLCEDVSSVRAAVEFIRRRDPTGSDGQMDPTRLAVLAVELSERFGAPTARAPS